MDICMCIDIGLCTRHDKAPGVPPGRSGTVYKVCIARSTELSLGFHAGMVSGRVYWQLGGIRKLFLSSLLVENSKHN
jgi:hypothetical protein